MSPLLDKLHDIEGLDPISWWPLAIGWWILIIMGLLITFVILVYFTSRFAFKRSWKNDTLQKLNYLEKNLSDTTGRETLILLSEYLRRIAIQHFPRNECAGLVGKDWLKWLSQHDPKKFNWEKHGILLIEAPYAPLNFPLPTNQIKELIQAVKNWVR